MNSTLSKLAPLYNMNTLVVVLLALVVYAEWRDVHLAKLLAGAALVVLGGLSLIHISEPTRPY